MKILVDTSVWIDHLKQSNQKLITHLTNGNIITHSLVYGELACGNLQNRNKIITNFRLLAHIDEVPTSDVINFINTNNLMGKGLGIIDMHLLASCYQTKSLLWTLDKKLDKISTLFRINYKN